MKTPDPQTPTRARRIGRYLVLEEFARGGMATVHFGRMVGDEGFSRVVAIKRMRSDLTDEEKARVALIDEGRIAARVQHVNVVQTLDVVTEGREVLLVLEFVKGESLDRLLKASAKLGERIPDGIVVAIVAGALRGVHAAHEAKAADGSPLELVHRDLSPHNIMIDSSGVARVADFGIARARGRLSDSTTTGQIKGKLAYMAPEQVYGETSRLTDVFSMGVVLWECLARQRLFRAENEAQLLGLVMRAEVPAIEGADPALMGVARRALARTPEGRFQSAAEMADALERVCPAATSGEVAEWLRRLAGVNIAEREARLRFLESSEFESPRAERRTLLLVVGVAALIGVASSAVLVARQSVPPPSLPPPPVVVLDAGVAAIAVPPAVPDAGETDAGEPDAEPAAPGELLDAGVPPPRPKVRSKPKKSADCTVPWFLDQNGRKRYKVECL